MTGAEWDALGWDMQRCYLDGMEQDESVPLTFEHGDERADAGGVMAGLPDGFAPQVREAAPESVIDITGMLSDLEGARRRPPA